jgi:hypothetical protein
VLRRDGGITVHRLLVGEERDGIEAFYVMCASDTPTVEGITASVAL